MRARQWLADAGRVAAGSAAMVKHLLTSDRADVGLGQVSAASATVARGRASRYDVTIASARSEQTDVTLRIDIRAADVGARADGRYTSFARRLAVEPRASTDVVVEYDWLESAGFRIGGVSLPADDRWKGTRDRPGPYAVSAILFDGDGRRLDSVTVYQRLMP